MAPPHVMPQAAENQLLDQLHRDLERLDQLPKTWKGLDPTSIAESVLETLLDMLDLDFAGLRFNDTTHIFFRVDAAFGASCPLDELRTAVDDWAASGAIEGALSVANQSLSVVQRPLGQNSSLGMIVVGTRRADFPTRLESSKLGIAASQATLACREMRELSDRQPPVDLRERPVSKETLAESEWRLHLTINTIPAMAWSTTPDGLIDFCNQNFVDYVGWTAEEIGGQGFWPIFHPDDTAYLLASWQDIMATKRPREVECRMRRADGEYRWFVLRQNPLFDADGNVIKWYGVGTDIEDRKRAETALKETEAALLASEQNLNLIINSLPVLIWSARPDGSADFINQSWRDYAGKPADKILEWGFLELYHPDDVPGMMEIWTRDLAHNDQTALKGRIRSADGEYRWFYFSGRKLTDANGVVRWFGVNVDIDDLVRAEDALKASEAALKENQREVRLMLDTIPVMAWATSADGMADSFNKSMLDYVGRPLEDMTGLGFHCQFHPDDLPRMAEEWEATMMNVGHGEIQGRVRRADGEYRWVVCRSRPLLNTEGAVERWYGVNLDIDDWKRAENALKASEEALRANERRLEHIINAIPGLVWSASDDGQVTFLSQQYLDYTGLSAEQAANDGWAVAVHPDDLQGLLAAWGAAFDGGWAKEHEARIRRADGEYRWHLFRVSPFHDDAGRLAHWFGVNVDVENRKRAQEELRQSQNDLAHVTRMTTMGELAVSIAHEVNQPLMAIVTNAGACLRWLDDAQTDIAMARQAAERIVRDGHRAGDIITSLRALARKSAPRMEAVSIDQIIQVVLDLLRGELQRNGVIAKAQLNDRAIAILGDSTQLQQVVLNLIMNAIEAMAGEAGDTRRLVVHSEIKDGSALVSIADTGPGLGADNPDRLFEAFYSTKPEGIGMGLSICSSIIEAHGGKIWAATNETRGSVFSFTLPLA